MPTDLQPTTRFSNRAADYARYRPDYPPQVIDVLRRRIGLDRSWIVADIGCGTGISSQLLLRNGNTVIGVEPNDAMRQSAIEQLGNHSSFSAVKGAAEATALPDASVDLVIAAQAYHWFDHAACAREWRRILRPAPGGFAVVMWNHRSAGGDAFSRDYEALLHQHIKEYAEVSHRHEVTRESFRRPFGVAFELEVLANHQELTWDQLCGRARSSSYVPTSGQPGHDELFAALRDAFDRHQHDGRIRFTYDTQIFLARIC